MTDTSSRPDYGVHSEVGRLRKVLVCSPGLAHERLTPTNCDALLFDDVDEGPPPPEPMTTRQRRWWWPWSPPTDR